MIEQLMKGVAFMSWADFLADEDLAGDRLERSIGQDGIIRRFGSPFRPPEVEEDAEVSRSAEALWTPPPAEVKAYSDAFQLFVDGKGPLPYVASDSTEDSYRDVITGPWRLKRFRSNPIMPLNHYYYGSLLPLGTSKVRYDKAGERLLGFAYFDEEDPEAKKVAGKYRRLIMRGFSVGIRPAKVVRRSSLDEDHPYYGKRGYWLCDCELLEVSAVTIPANANAVSQKGVDPAAQTATSARTAPAAAQTTETALPDPADRTAEETAASSDPPLQRTDDGDADVDFWSTSTPNPPAVSDDFWANENF
jgi:hypothetical protein